MFGEPDSCDQKTTDKLTHPAHHRIVSYLQQQQKSLTCAHGTRTISETPYDTTYTHVFALRYHSYGVLVVVLCPVFRFRTLQRMFYVCCAYVDVIRLLSI